MEEECCQLVSLRMSWKQAECKPCSQKLRQASLAGLQNQLLTLIAPHLFLLPKTRSVIVYRNHLPKQRVVLLLIRISKNRFIDVKYQVVKCKVHRCQTIWKYGPLGVFFHQTYVSQTSFIYEFDESVEFARWIKIDILSSQIVDLGLGLVPTQQEDVGHFSLFFVLPLKGFITNEGLMRANINGEGSTISLPA